MSKYVLEPYFLETAKSLNADFAAGSVFECFAYYGLVIQMNVTVLTDISGVIKVQHSSDKLNWVDSTIFAPITWTTKTTNFSDAFVTQGMVPWKYLRLNWDNTAGTGSFDVILTGVRV